MTRLNLLKVREPSGRGFLFSRMIFVTASEARASLRASRPRGSHSGAMDFAELERKEGVRLSWNAWPSSRIEATRVVLPFGAVCTPVKAMEGMPVLPYAPVVCSECSGVLNPYCHVDFHQKRWQCCLCNTGNTLPRNYHGE